MAENDEKQSLFVSLPTKTMDDVEQPMTSKMCSSTSSDHTGTLADSSYFDAYSALSTSRPTVFHRPIMEKLEANSTEPNPIVLNRQTVEELAQSLVTERMSMPLKVEPKQIPGEPQEKACDSDEDLFECGICTEDLKIPKSLPCLHNFCLDCLEKYFRANSLKEEQSFACPTCRASVTIPKGGSTNFPTNFHIVNLRKRTRDLDIGITIKDAVRYLESRAEEIVDELTERKRQVLIRIGQRREQFIGRIENLVESLQASLEEQYSDDSTQSVEVINSVKIKLCELQEQLSKSYTDDSNQNSPEAIKLNALKKLRRQAEIISNVNNELEELKCQADKELSRILDYQTQFSPGAYTQEQMAQSFGELVALKEGQTLADARKNDTVFSPLSVKSWSQSWWVMLFAVLPAVICAMIIKALMTIFDKLLD